VNTAETSILVLFTFGATIFYVLLAIERRVWAGSLTFGSDVRGKDGDVRFVHAVLKHLLASGLSLILVIFGTFALGAYLIRSRAPRPGLVAMVITVFGTLLFLMIGGVSTFAVPEEGQAVLAGLEEFEKLPDIFANTVMGLTGLAVIVLSFVGNILLGVAVWRSGVLPRWAGALWAGAHVLMYLSLMYAQMGGPASTPPTVPFGAAVVVISGAWMALSVLREPSARTVGVGAQPSVQ